MFFEVKLTPVTLFKMPLLGRHTVSYVFHWRVNTQLLHGIPSTQSRRNRPFNIVFVVYVVEKSLQRKIVSVLKDQGWKFLRYFRVVLWNQPEPEQKGKWRDIKINAKKITYDLIVFYFSYEGTRRELESEYKVTIRLISQCKQIFGDIFVTSRSIKLKPPSIIYGF